MPPFAANLDHANLNYDTLIAAAFLALSLTASPPTGGARGRPDETDTVVVAECFGLDRSARAEAPYGCLGNGIS